MKIKFDYNYSMEFCLRTYSVLSIKGKGEWNVDEDELIEEWNPKEHDIIDFIKEYFWMTLDVNPDSIIFDKEDLDELVKYMKMYKETL